MPIRRSINSSPATTFNSPSSRLRSDLSHDAIPTSSMHDFGIIPSRPEGSSGEGKVVSALVGRIVNKLPCNSGIRFSVFEADNGIRASLESLLQFSRIRLELVVHSLSSALETLSKYSSSTSILDTSLDTLQSQLYLLNVLHLCLSESWRHQAKSTTPPNSNTPRLWPDPPAMEEGLARYTFGVLLIYIRMVSSENVPAPGTSSPASSRESRNVAGPSTSTFGRSPSSSTYTLGTRFLQQHSYSTSASPHSPRKSKPLSTTCGTTSTTITQMTKLLSRITFYLTASNWSQSFTRIKSRLQHLTTTIEDNPDLIELRFLEWSNLNRQRLSQILSEISISFLHIKRPSQVAVATVFRQAIWNWITAYPSEYETLIESNRKMEGGPDVLFDVLASMSDLSSSSNARRTRVFYPLMAMMLVLSPDILKKVVLGDMGPRGAGSLSKKVHYLESLRKGLNGGKGVEACVGCYVDLVAAAVALSGKYDNSGVRSLLPEIQNELKNALFNLTYSSEISDPNLFVDGLVAVYRADPVNTLTQFSKLWSDSNENKQSIAIKACEAIYIQSKRLPWQPTYSSLKSAGAPAARALLQVLVGQLNGASSTPRRPRVSSDLPGGRGDLIVELLNLLALDTGAAMEGIGVKEPNEMAKLLDAVGELMVVPTSDHIRNVAVRTGVVILDGIAEQGVDERGKAGLGESLWGVLICVSRQALYAFQSGDPDDMSAASSSLSEITQALQRVSASTADSTLASILASASNQANATLLAFVTIATILTCPDVEQISSASPVLSALARLTEIASAEEVLGDKASPAGRAVKVRVALIEELTRLPPAAGRQQQQKAYRKVIRQYARPLTSSIAIWLGVAAVARSLTSKIIAADADSTAFRTHRPRGLTADIDGLDEEQSKSWQNQIFFLCSVIPVCMYDTSPPPTLSEVMGKGVLPRIYEELTDPLVAAEAFIRENVDLLVSQSVHVRETVKEALGAELPSSAGRMLVSQMTKLLSHARSSSGITTSGPFTTFVDSTISILRLFIDRLSSTSYSGTALDIGELLLLVGEYVHRLGRDENALRLKSRYCGLIEVVLGKLEFVMIGNEGVFRNTVLDWLSEWSLETVRESEGYHLGVDNNTGKAQKELDHASLRAMVPVADGLILRIQDVNDDEGQDVVVKTRLFYRHYHQLVRILERSHMGENDSRHYAPSSATTQPNNALQTNKPNDDPSSLAIQILSNLLSTNIDAGLKYCLTLGYNDNQALRTAFMQVMSNVLRRGARFAGLGGSGPRAASVSRRYLDLISAGDMALALGICEACPPGEVDEISLLMFRVFEAKGTLLVLLKILVEKEVAYTSHAADLFRANSFTTRMLTVFARTYGYNYVRATVQPLVQTLIEKPAECSFELDPSKVAPGEDIERNAESLQVMCQAMLDLICGSSQRVPILFRALSHIILEAVESRFPDAIHPAIGSFIFLRFFCPAIVSPDTVDLDVPSDPQVRRALLLVTKVIQNIVNGVGFGVKEPHMKVLNGFLERNGSTVMAFLGGIASKPKTWEVSAAVKEYQDEAERLHDGEGDDMILHKFVFKHDQKLERVLESMRTSQYPSSSHANGNGNTNGAKSPKVGNSGLEALALLRALMEETGPLGEAAKLSAVARAQVYDDFMRHNTGRNTDSVAQAFYEGPVSQNGRRLFYFVTSRVGLVDYDLLAYHVFTVLEKVTDFFDIVIDMTSFSASNELPLAWLKRSLQMCPPGILPCVNVLALYNVNTYAKRRIRRIVFELSNLVPSIGKQVISASSPSELAEFIPFTSLSLPEFTMELAFEAKHVFTNLLCTVDHDHHVPVVAKLGHDCIQIGSWRKQEVTSTFKAYIIEVIMLKDIDDVLVGGSIPQDHLVIKHSQNESLRFISRKRMELAKHLRAGRAKLRDAPSSEERALRPSDVPATLLNVALLNLSAGDDAPRVGSYNLLLELATFFKYDIPQRMLRTPGLNIPGNSLALTTEFSKSLSTTAPHLTLDLLKEWCIGFSKADVPSKTAALVWIAPWLVKLENFAKPSSEEGVDHLKSVSEVVRLLIAVTVAERRRLHLAIHDQVWTVLGRCHEALVKVIVSEIIHATIDAGVGSEKAECCGEILISIASTTVRGLVIAKLRKTIAQTYNKPSQSLTSSQSWPEIAALTRLTLALTFNPPSPLDIQLFLPELCHIITLLLSCGSLLVRQSVYSLCVNVVAALSAGPTNGDMDGNMLDTLLKRVTGEKDELLSAFGLSKSSIGYDLLGKEDEVDVSLLSGVEQVAKYLGEVIAAGAVSMDCANAWRARWMGLVAGTCFQHNPATQPQAFTVLGYLASDEADDDLLYQVLVAMATVLNHFSENDNILVTAILQCLSRVTPGLLPESRYAGSLFWIGVAICQLGYIPLFAPALELILVSLKAMEGDLVEGNDALGSYLLSVRAETEAGFKLDKVGAVSFETDVGFSLVAVLFKGVRHPSTRGLTLDVLQELLRLSVLGKRGGKGDGGAKVVGVDSVGYFVALLPILMANGGDVKGLFATIGVDVEPESVGERSLKIYEYLDVPDNSKGLLLVTLVTSMLSMASSDAEKLILYRLLDDAATDIPEVMVTTYDTLMPRITANLATTPSIPILQTLTSLLNKAISDANYTFPSQPGLSVSESMTSLSLHQKSYSGSISSQPSISGADGGWAGRVGGRDHMLEDLGMKGLAELGFPGVKMDRVGPMAQWVSALIEAYTS